MILLQFNEILKLSNNDIIEKIIKAKNELCLLRFKKITQQNFKPSDLKKLKSQIAKLKTALVIRVP